MNCLEILLNVAAFVILIGITVCMMNKRKKYGGVGELLGLEEKFEMFKAEGSIMKMKEDRFIKENPNEDVPGHSNPGTWWTIHSEDLDKNPLGEWTKASKEIKREDGVDYNNPIILQKQDDFSKPTPTTPKRVKKHFINQLIRIPNKKTLTEETLMQIAYNIGQGSVDGQVEASKYPMSFFYNP